MYFIAQTQFINKFISWVCAIKKAVTFGYCFSFKLSFAEREGLEQNLSETIIYNQLPDIQHFAYCVKINKYHRDSWKIT